MGARWSPVRWFRHGGWYFLVVMTSLGVLTPVPFVHAATRLGTPWSWLWTAVYTAAVVGLLVVTGSGHEWVGGAIPGLIVVAVVHLVWLRRQVWPPRPAGQVAEASRVAEAGRDDPAIAAARAARQRREQAREIVGTDPALARDLRIGQPELPGDYDDGGLVDLNSASASAIADICGIELELAHRIVDTRVASGHPFQTVEDVFIFVELPVEVWQRLHERAVTVP